MLLKNEKKSMLFITTLIVERLNSFCLFKISYRMYSIYVYNLSSDRTISKMNQNYLQERKQPRQREVEQSEREDMLEGE